MGKNCHLFFCLLFFCSFTAFTQQNATESENIIWAKIEIPMIVNLIEETDYTHPNIKDVYKEVSGMKSYVNINLLNFPLRVRGTRFQGSYKNRYYPYDSTWFDGVVSENRMMLKELTLERCINYHDKHSDETEKLKIMLKELPMFNGVCTFDTENSGVNVSYYTYMTESRSRHQTFRRTTIFQKIDFDPIKNHYGNWKFRIQIHMDGPPSYLILVNDIRGEDLTWEPPVSDLIGTGKALEPKSVGIYMNDDGMDEKTVILTNGIALQISVELLKKPGLKILERGKLSSIIQEIKLSETGMVSEETRISPERLMKEEFALFMKAGMDTISKESRMECEIFCKKGAKKIRIVNIDLRMISNAIHDLSEKIYSIINEYVNK